MCTGCRPLEPFQDSRRLLEYLRGVEGTAEGKNHVLHALLRCRRPDSDVADVILTLALWPALDRFYRQLCAGFRGDPDGVAGEMIGAFAKACRSADPDRISAVAATLTMNAGRDAKRSLLMNKGFASLLEPDIEELCEAQRPLGGCPAEMDDGDDGSRLKERLERDFGEDAGLVFDVAVHGLTQREAAARQGLSHDAGRKRYQRTTTRIREQRPDYLRPRVPVRSPDWHLSVEGTGAAGAMTDDDNAGTRGRTRAAPGAVSPVGTPRDPADRRRVPDRTRRSDNGRRNSRRGVPPRR